jgi:1-acyl-sn-glycerol-3-phosphate acyltransferase
MIVKVLARLLLRVKIEGVENIPRTGSVILATNHVNFIDAPLLYVLLPREATALTKVETWDNPLLGWVATSWHAIPIHRGELDLQAFRSARNVLKQGKVLGIALEGTRSHHGHLLRGRPGAVLLALHAPEALIVPMAIYGHEHYEQDWKRLRRTPVNIVYGQGFHLKPVKGQVTHEIRQKITDEIMMQIAALLPQQNRGVYSDLASATEDYLEFPPGATSNVRRAMERSAMPGEGKSA